MLVLQETQTPLNTSFFFFFDSVWIFFSLKLNEQKLQYLAHANSMVALTIGT